MDSDISRLKHVVVDERLTDAEVHPAGAYEALRAAARGSAARLLERGDQLVDVACPGCDRTGVPPAFMKDGFQYRSCPDCWSLFVSPRPTAEQMRWYLRDSDYAECRRSPAFLEATARTASEVAQVRAEWLDPFLPEGKPAIVVHAQSVELLAALARRRPIVALDPLVDCSSLANVKCVLHAREAPEGCCGLILLDVIESVGDLPGLFASLVTRLAPKATLALTTRSSSGIDVLTLRDRCPTIFAPTHLNLLSVEGVHALVQRHGFRTQELSTPGLLDVEVLRRALAQNPDADDARFFRYLLEHRGEEARARLQRFLQQTQTSSHVRLVASFAGTAG